MDWLMTAVLLAGFVAGFFSGASPSPAAGTVVSAVAAFLVGILVGLNEAQNLASGLDGLGFLATLFLLSLLIAYVCAKVLRRQGKLEWMGLEAIAD